MKPVWLGLCLLCVINIAVAQPRVLMEAHLLNEAGESVEELNVKVGQRVTLALDILTDTWFTRAPEIQPVELTGAISLEPEQFGTNYSLTREGVSYAVQRREITIFPQRAGQFILPSMMANVWVAGADGERLAKQQVRSEPLVFQVAAVMQEEGEAQAVLVAEEVAIQETFNPTIKPTPVHDEESRPLYAGDAVTRQITITAKGTLGMLIKPLSWMKIDGVRQQPSRAKVQDRTNRGEFTGIRTETRSYIFEHPGEYILPAVSLTWWDQTQQQLRTVTLPEHVISVVSGGLLTAGGGVTNQTDNRVAGVWLEWIAIGITLVLTVAALFWGGSFCWRQWRQRRQRYQQGEAYQRSLLLKACREGERDVVVQRFYRWRHFWDSEDQLTPVFLALQEAVVNYYQVYYRLTDEQRQQRLMALEASIQAMPVKTKRKRLAAGLPRRRALAELNPSERAAP